MGGSMIFAIGDVSLRKALGDSLPQTHRGPLTKATFGGLVKHPLPKRMLHSEPISFLVVARQVIG